MTVEQLKTHILTMAEYLREERFPPLKGDLYNEAGNFTARILYEKKALTLANGANSNIDIGDMRWAVIGGPSAGFSVTGFTGGSDGRPLYLFNNVAQVMTITNDATSTAANRILTLTGADVVLRAGRSFATFMYSGDQSRWVLVATN